MDPYVLSNSELWTVVAGTLLPLVVALVNRPKWSDGVRSGVMVLAVLVVTTVGEFFTGRMTQPGSLTEWVRSAFVIFVLTVTSYQFVWKKMGVAPRIEAATAPDPDPSGRGSADLVMGGAVVPVEALVVGDGVVGGVPAPDAPNGLVGAVAGDFVEVGVPEPDPLPEPLSDDSVPVPTTVPVPDPELP